MAFAGYFLLNKLGRFTLAQVWLIGMSLWFYGYFNISYLPIICVSILLNYIFSKSIEKNQGKIKKVLLAAGVMLNVASIFYFKYYDFFITNINNLFGKNFELQNILLPLGISFFTFQQISFLVDAYKGETKEYGFVEYSLFVVFFPQLIAGPIVLHREMIPQFRDIGRKKINEDNVAWGIFVFALGLFKKVILADTLGCAVSWGYEEVFDLTSLETLIVSLSYTFQLYFDFSGYCDMALGIGKMFNIDLPWNFNSPYKSGSILEFWDRWHMTLTRFLREYVYFPLGGSRKGKIRTYINVFFVFLLSGLWHGANWTFVLWGALHGAAQCINRAIRPLWDKLWIGIRWFCTFAFVNCTWIIFRAESVSKGLRLVSKLFLYDADSAKIRVELFESFRIPEFKFMELHIGFWKTLVENNNYIYALMFIIIGFLIVLFGKNTKEIRFRQNVATAAFTVILLVWSILSLAGLSTFLYFNF